MRLSESSLTGDERAPNAALDADGTVVEYPKPDATRTLRPSSNEAPEEWSA
ncbi:hypothetical protein [Halomicrococcus sp. NG-SE-24]|uniref:hypothetical protein n=1 Tax=Halomicrococcus sp. NG-SE-24 TaxID=3436928 RepID=UPI003D97C127